MITTIYRTNDGREFTSKCQALGHDRQCYTKWVACAAVIPDRVRGKLDDFERLSRHAMTDRELFDHCLKLLFDAGVDPMTGEYQ